MVRGVQQLARVVLLLGLVFEKLEGMESVSHEI
jgi:hypothetical protein